METDGRPLRLVLLLLLLVPVGRNDGEAVKDAEAGGEVIGEGCPELPP